MPTTPLSLRASRASAPHRSALECTDQENAMLGELAATLIVSNFSQYDAERKTSPSPLTGDKSRRWKEIRKKEGIRIYQERETPGEPLALPSLLLCGAIVGTLEDVMYAQVAHTDESTRVKAFVEQDGVADCRVLHDVVGPSVKDPFHHVQVKWHLVTQPQAVDFVVLDSTGLATTEGGETIGYHLQHSVDFARLPPVFSSAARDAKRGNMSVCALFRQKTPAMVEVHMRGFYDLGSASSTDALFLHGIANHWLSSFTHKAELSQMKKLAWLTRRRMATAQASRTSTWSVSSSEYPPPLQKLGSHGSVSGPSGSAPGRCKVCSKSFGFLGTSRRNCRCCEGVVCTRCSVSKVLVEFAPSTQFTLSSSSSGSRGGGNGGAIVEKKRTFCSQCMTEATRGNACTIAREEVLGYN
jgi:hypothetical protein